MHAVHYIALSKPLPPELEILTPKVPIKNVKIAIACNSAYIQTETLIFTFARQAVIVYFDAEH